MLLIDECEALDRHLWARRDEFQITRVADTTGLDRTGVPTASCVRPGTTDAIWVYSGKGSTFPEARMTAMMECIERTSALWDMSLVRKDPPPDEPRWPVERFTERLAPREVPVRLWVRAEDLRRQTPVWVPADLVFLGRRPPESGPSSVAVVTSNGVAAGTNRDGAIAAALRELIERDAVSCAELRASHFAISFLAAMSRAFGIESGLDSFRDDDSVATPVDPATLPQSARAIFERMMNANLEVSIKWIPSSTGVPVFGAAAIEPMWDGFLAAAGYGASLDAEEAVRKALLELAQSRATDRQGAREDSFEVEKARLSSVPRHHWLSSSTRALTSFDALNVPRSPRADVGAYLESLEAGELTEVAVVDLPTWPGLFVVRVLVPEIETWHATGGESSLGRRMRAAFGLT